MSNKRTKAGRKDVQRRAQVSERRKPKGDQAPKVDPDRSRATVAQLVRVHEALSGQLGQHGEAIRKLAETSHENSTELKRGLDASEFNLRAHQKVINALAIELERLRTVMTAMLPDEAKDKMQPVIEMADVTLPADDGEEPVVVRRVDWPYYHGQVEKDLKILAEEEARILAEEEARIAKEAEEAATQAIAEEADDAVLSTQEEPTPQAGDGANEEAGAPLQDDGVPEGAAVFGEG
jgi:hypothetical protein